MRLIDIIQGHPKTFARRATWDLNHIVYVTRIRSAGEIYGKPLSILKTDFLKYVISQAEKRIPETEADDWQSVPDITILKTIIK